MFYQSHPLERVCLHLSVTSPVSGFRNNARGYTPKFSAIRIPEVFNDKFGKSLKQLMIERYMEHHYPTRMAAGENLVTTTPHRGASTRNAERVDLVPGTPRREAKDMHLQPSINNSHFKLMSTPPSKSKPNTSQILAFPF
jgi:hypothetical protein